MGDHPTTAGSETKLQSYVDLALQGNTQAKELLLHHACDRLLRLTRRMFHGSHKLRRWEQTDDVFQNSMLRLHRALGSVEVQSVRHFFNLASVQIRRELVDMGRKHFGPLGIGKNHHTDHISSDNQGGALHSLTEKPEDISDWTEFHERVEGLPEEEREVVDLVYYDGLPHEEVAKLLGISERTVRRRWQSAKVRLYSELNGDEPTTGRDPQ